MKIRMLRNLGSDLIKQLTADGVELPDDGAVEGKELDVPEKSAENLFSQGLAEAAAKKSAKGDGAKGARAEGDAPEDAADGPVRQEGTWKSSTAREQQEAEASKKQQLEAAEGQKAQGAKPKANAPAGEQPKTGPAEQPKANAPAGTTPADADPKAKK